MIFFSGVDSLKNLLEADEHTRLGIDKALTLFDFRIKLSGTFGVKCIHIEEEMMLVLHQIRELFQE
jgi:hypothetical protein